MRIRKAIDICAKTVVFTCDGDISVLKFFKEVMHKAERHWSDDTDKKDLSVV